MFAGLYTMLALLAVMLQVAAVPAAVPTAEALAAPVPFATHEHEHDALVARTGNGTIAARAYDRKICLASNTDWCLSGSVGGMWLSPYWKASKVEVWPYTSATDNWMTIWVNEGAWTPMYVRANEFRNGARVKTGLVVDGDWTSWKWISGNRLSLFHTNTCLDIPAGNYYEGAPISIWVCHDGANQKFVYRY